MYYLYLKELHLSYKISSELSGLNSSLMTPEEFINAYNTSSPKQKNLLCEFYIHNYVVPYTLQWNPLLSIGDVHLREFMFYIQNENGRGEKAREYMNMEQIVPLPLRDEVGDPDEIYYRWNRLTDEQEVKRKMLSIREKFSNQYE